jgi:hypothetical protein
MIHHVRTRLYNSRISEQTCSIILSYKADLCQSYKYLLPEGLGLGKPALKHICNFYLPAHK